MRVLVAPDKFKSSLTAAKVADHLAKGLGEAGAHGGTFRWPTAATVASPPPWPPDRSLPVDVAGRPDRAARSVVTLDADATIVEVADTCRLAALPGGVLGAWPG